MRAAADKVSDADLSDPPKGALPVQPHLIHLVQLAEGTPQSRLDGTTSGIVVLVVVMLPVLAFFIGLVYWSARNPGRGYLPAAGSPAAAEPAEELVTAASGRPGSRVIVQQVEPDDETPGA
jgi:hypothetical protein